MAAKKILIADDDRRILQLLSMSLRKEGYEVVNAVDAYQAIQFAHEHRPDLCILDVNMPAGDGLSVQERLQKIAALCTTPVIYLTGDRSERVAATAKKLGAVAVLHKPFETEQLLQTVRAALGEETTLQAAAR